MTPRQAGAFLEYHMADEFARRAALIEASALGSRGKEKELTKRMRFLTEEG